MTQENQTCAECGILFSAPSPYIAARRKDGDAFHCPNGHYLTFGEGETEKLRRERDRLKQKQAELHDRHREDLDAERRRTAAAKGQVTKMKRRSAAGVCPCCNRTFKQLAAHMKNQHPSFSEAAS